MDHWQATISETGTGRPVDALIAPVASSTAHLHGKDGSVLDVLDVVFHCQSLFFLHSYASYTSVWNVLDYTACAFPVSVVDPIIDQKKPPPYFPERTGPEEL